MFSISVPILLRERHITLKQPADEGVYHCFSRSAVNSSQCAMIALAADPCAEPGKKSYEVLQLPGQVIRDIGI